MIFVIDLGTTGVRCIAYNEQYNRRASNYIEIGHSAPQPGHFTQNLSEILELTIQVIYKTWLDAGSPQQVTLGITNQRESIAVWDVFTGEPLSPSLNWQDMRFGKAMEEMLRDGREPYVHAVTGLRLFPYFSAGKMSWVFDHVPGLREANYRDRIAMGTLDSWLIWSLTGGPDGGLHVTDVSNASRTCLMDLKTLTWSPDLLRMFEISESVLPRIVPSGDPSAYGFLRHERLPFQGQIVSVIGDQQSSLLGQSCLDMGAAKNTYGTASAILINTQNNIHTECSDLLSTVLYQIKGNEPLYALEGSTGATGGLIAWLKDNLGILSSINEASELAASVENSGGVVMVPALSGLFAPYWDFQVRGSISGLTMHTNKAHIARAAFESIAFQTADVLQIAKAQAGVTIREIRVDGGGARNEFLLQLQADILGIPVMQSDELDFTAQGAAFLAGMTIGELNIDDIRTHYKLKKTFEPSWNADRREEAYHTWQKTIMHARNGK
ncbi:MAG: FGGY family carbohydrate kinase [Paenibacillaceae bacterium]